MLGASLVIVGFSRAWAQTAISIADTSVVEGNSGVTNAEFVVTLSAPYSDTVTVSYTTFEVPYDYFNEPYPAASGSDFIATNGVLTFAPGETNKSVFVQVIGDTINEADERFGLSATLYTTNGSTDTVGYCTILDDDPLEILVNDCAVIEGNDGTTYANITLTTYQTTEQTVYGTATPQSGTATAGSDFPYPTASSWQLPPGGPTTNFICCSVPISGDTNNEDDEVFYVNIGLGYGGRYAVRPKDINPPNARGVVFLKSQATVTIINDDFYLTVLPLATNRSQLTLFGALNATHVLQSSSDFVNWTSFSTNTLGPERQVSIVVTNNGNRYYRALRIANVSQ